MHKEIICWRHRICIVPKSDLFQIMAAWNIIRLSLKTAEIIQNSWIDYLLQLNWHSQNPLSEHCAPKEQSKFDLQLFILACCDFVSQKSCLISFYGVIFWIFNLVSILCINRILWIHILQALKRHKRESRKWLNRKSVRVIYNSIKYLRGKTFKTLYLEIELNTKVNVLVNQHHLIHSSSYGKC